MRAPAVEPIRLALVTTFPRWAQVIGIYQRYREEENRRFPLRVMVATTAGELHCRRCHRSTVILPGQAITERCCHCGTMDYARRPWRCASLKAWMNSKCV